MYKSLLLLVAVAFLLIVPISLIRAEGSKDMYPRGVKGNRAYMSCGITANYNTSFPFMHHGVHYVYVKEGETLAVASSAQGVEGGYIILTDPTSNTISTQFSPFGQIKDNGLGTREAELLGPRIGYRPFEVVVNSSSAGIWKIEFIGAYPNSNNQLPPNILANDNWTQSSQTDQVAAWDISVYSNNSNSWIEGRVYVNSMNLFINTGEMKNAAGGFYGKNYVLTQDGYVYLVDGNGSVGMAFTYFVNNKGFLNSDGSASYKSVNSTSQGSFNIQDPRLADAMGSITHKMMYNLPDKELPKVANGAVPGGNTWFLNKRAVAKLKNIRLVGVEGNENFVSTRGANIIFETNYASNYRITISSGSEEKKFEKKQIIVSALEGVNKFYWNGKDGNDSFIPFGDEYPIHIQVELLAGEVHFPYLDMEINPLGIIIQLLSDDYKSVENDLVYWNDVNVSPGALGESSSPQINLNGISSKINGHKWGTYRNQTLEDNTNSNYGYYSYGNEKSMDTWTYSTTINERIIKNVHVKLSDLKVEKIDSDTLIMEIGKPVNYKIKVSNDGPSDAEQAVFTFTLPRGFVLISAKYQSDCATVIQGSALRNVYSAIVSIKNGCSFIFEILARPTEAVTLDQNRYVHVEASILRPADVTDPDATSVLPYDGSVRRAETECLNNGGNGACNNVLRNGSGRILESENERGKITLTKRAQILNTVPGQIYNEVGQVIEYTFNIKNSGLVTVDHLKLYDPMLSTNNLPISVDRLREGENYNYKFYYTITKQDYDRGYVENSATLTGVNPRGFDLKDVSGTAEDNDTPTVVTLKKGPNLRLRKTIVNNGTGVDGVFTIDDEIEYLFEIQIANNYPLTNLRLEDPMISSNQLVLPSQSINDENIQLVARYKVTEDDIERGLVVNSAVITAFDVLNNTTVNDISGIEFDNDIATITRLPRRGKAIRDEASLKQNNSLELDVLKNDSTAGAAFLKDEIEIITMPANGIIRYIQDGRFLYTPNKDYYGDDVFTYRVLDQNRLWSTIGQVEIHVEKTKPIAKNDHIESFYKNTATINVVENDWVEGAKIDHNSLQIVKQPINGSIMMLANGQVQYIPNKNFTGVDVFSYVVKDTNGWESNEAQVYVVMNGFLIPNTFTPNNDGINDFFEILGTYQFDKIKLEIYNRLGQLLYHSDDYKNDWDATGLIDGTYYYSIGGYSNQTEVFNQKGTVAVIRKIAY